MTFSRTFPANHPLKGKPTYFVEKILVNRGIDFSSANYLNWLIENNPKISKEFLTKFYAELNREIVWPKVHTIRNHKKALKPGDFVSPHCWAGKPYKKTKEGFWQIKFAPDMEVKKVWKFEICETELFVDRKPIYEFTAVDIALNDGLLYKEFLNWFHFPKEFSGTIICWDQSIQY